MIPLLGLSQNTDTPNNSFDVYQGLINGDNCRKNQLPECLKVAADLNKIIQDQSKSIISFANQKEKDQKELKDLNDLKETQAVKIQKLESRKTPWYKHPLLSTLIGFSTGVYIAK